MSLTDRQRDELDLERIALFEAAGIEVIFDDCDTDDEAMRLVDLLAPVSDGGRHAFALIAGVTCAAIAQAEGRS